MTQAKVQGEGQEAQPHPVAEAVRVLRALFPIEIGQSYRLCRTCWVETPSDDEAETHLTTCPRPAALMSADALERHFREPDKATMERVMVAGRSFNHAQLATTWAVYPSDAESVRERMVSEHANRIDAMEEAARLNARAALRAAGGLDP